MPYGGRFELERDDPVRNAVELHVRPFGRAIIEQQNSAVPPHKELFQRQDLTPVPQRVLCQQTQLGQGIENHARRLQTLDRIEHFAGRFGQLHLGRVQHREIVFPVELIGVCHQLDHLDAIQRPTMRLARLPSTPPEFRTRVT